MTDTDFEFDLERAFRETARDADTAALERAILGRIERADRQRWLVLSCATVLGLAITAALVLGSGFVAAAHGAWLELRTAIELEAPDAPWPVALYALVGLIVLASSIARAARDS
jgi:hypothetical protein